MFHLILLCREKGKTVIRKRPSPAERLPSLGRSSWALQSVARSPLLRGYSMGRYGSLWAASAGDICPSLYSEYGCSVCTSSSVVLVYSLSLYSDILQLCNLCLGPNNIQVYFVFLLFLSNRLDNFLLWLG